MRRRRIFRSLILRITPLVLVLAAIAVFGPSRAWAQSAAITGTVTDVSSGVMAGAAVKVHNDGTGIDTVVETNRMGIYRVEEPAGVYDVSVQKSGFKVVTYTNVRLTVEQILTLNVKMEVGQVSQSVVVNAAAVAPVELETAQISNLIDQKQILDMPLITRDPYSLTLLSPGVIATDAYGGFSANGARERDNNFLLDGVDNNDADVPGNPGGLNSLNPDSTQEFRVITNNFSAEYGRNNGAIIDVITKSGTNDIHGDAYWFGRYDVTGARDFFNHLPDTPKDPYIRNIFGASAGGPLIKDKTFWFVNYEGDRFITTLTNVSDVPNAAFRTGMFDATDPTSGNQIPIDVSTAGSANNGVGLPLDPTIQKILAVYPTPNGPTIDNAVGEYFFPSSDRERDDDFTIKLDHHINDKNTLSGRYAYDFYTDPNPFHSDFLPGDLGAIASSAHTQNLGVDWTSTLRSNLVNDLKVGGNRTNLPFSCTGTAVFDSFGFVDPFGRGADYDLSDAFGGGVTNFGCQGLGDLDKEARYTGTYQLLEGLSWVHGTHSMKYGAEFRDVYSNSYDDFGSRSNFDFEPEYDYGTGVLQGLDGYPGIEQDPILNDEVAMLLGYTTAQSQTQFFNKDGVREGDDLRGFRQREIAVYAQDSWKVRRNLTFNYGLRWEYYGVPFEAHNNFSNLFVNPAGPAPFTFTIVGPGAARPMWNNEYRNFEPRVGFAWDPFGTGKTSIRGAYGIFHDRAYGNLFEDARANPPFEQTFASPALYYGPAPLSSLSTPTTVPTSATVQSFANGGGFLFPDLIDPNFHTPYSQNWNFGIQRLITQSLRIEVNYVGVRGLRLFRVVDGNPPQPAAVAALETYCQNPDNLYGCVDQTSGANPQSTLTGYNLWIGQEEGTLPFDAAGNNAFEENCCTPGADLNKSIANSYYNGLQMNVTQRLSHGVQIQGAYTWAHALDNASDPLEPTSGNRSLPRNSFRLGAEYGNSDNDVRQTLVINYVYQPNLGRGRGYMNNGAVGRIMEGFELVGITTFETGIPYDIFGDRDSQHTGLSDRADQVGSVAIPAGSQRIETGPPLSAFADAPYDSHSNLTRNRFYGPGINNFNVSLLKTQSLNDRVKLQMRFEFYNLFNRVQFGQPSNSLAAPGIFGLSSNQVGEPDATTGARQIQFALKLMF